MESEEHRLLARLISNVCRRKVPSEEKTEMLDSLGQFYLEQGVPHSELVRKIVQNTGMSYRWVMKYASDLLKVRPGLGGPRSQKSAYENEVAWRATRQGQIAFGAFRKNSKFYNLFKHKFCDDSGRKKILFPTQRSSH